MQIQLLNEENAAAFRNIRLKALREHPESFGSSFEAEEQMSLDEWINRLRPSDEGNYGSFGAFEGDLLVGIIAYFRHKGTKVEHKATIVSVYVDSAFRGKGIAKALMLAVEEHVRKFGCIEQLHLSVVSDNQSAKSLYESIGFSAYGEEPRALKVDGRYYDEFHMIKFL